jgi:hypothetical protein
LQCCLLQQWQQSTLLLCPLPLHKHLQPCTYRINHIYRNIKEQIRTGTRKTSGALALLWFLCILPIRCSAALHSTVPFYSSLLCSAPLCSDPLKRFRVDSVRILSLDSQMYVWLELVPHRQLIVSVVVSASSHLCSVSAPTSQILFLSIIQTNDTNVTRSSCKVPVISIRF